MTYALWNAPAIWCCLQALVLLFYPLAISSCWSFTLAIGAHFFFIGIWGGRIFTRHLHQLFFTKILILIQIASILGILSLCLKKERDRFLCSRLLSVITLYCLYDILQISSSYFVAFAPNNRQQQPRPNPHVQNVMMIILFIRPIGEHVDRFAISVSFQWLEGSFCLAEKNKSFYRFTVCRYIFRRPESLKKDALVQLWVVQTSRMSKLALFLSIFAKNSIGLHNIDNSHSPFGHEVAACWSVSKLWPAASPPIGWLPLLQHIQKGTDGIVSPPTQAIENRANDLFFSRRRWISPITFFGTGTMVG